ncbi:MAG: methylenetetrahydrofolate reductase [bacterium]|nr:methylenetetrahydrofolate reductase [bacterium]
MTPPASSTLRRKLEAGQFVLTVEMVPPRAPDLENITRRLQKFFAGNADGVNVTDCASAILRMSSLCASRVCIDEGLEPVMQLTCRDRNRIGLQSELISAWAMGIRNVLCLTGDHVRFGDHPTAKPVFDMDSTNLIAMVSRMRAEGKYCSGEEIRTSAKSDLIKMDWLIGGAANPFGNEPEDLALHMDKKRRAGADFLQTQPVYDIEAFDAWWRAMEARGLHRSLKILPGILPPKGAKGLEYMKTSVPGMHVPDATIRRMQGAADAQAEGRAIALELVDRLLAYPIAGIHLYPVMWESVIPELAAEIRGRAAKTGRTMDSVAPAGT